MPQHKHKPRSLRSSKAFTLIELVVVLMLMGAMGMLVVYSTGTSAYWKRESFLRKLTETMGFLHHQAQADQAFYRIDFKFEAGVENSYRVHVVRPEENTTSQQLAQAAGMGAGALTLELTSFLYPSVGSAQTLIPPPSFPSLAKPITFPVGTFIEALRTMRGKKTMSQDTEAYILFSPRGFSEFAVIHLNFGENDLVTILVNPFTGNAQIFRSDEYKEFEWTYGGKGSQT